MAIGSYFYFFSSFEIYFSIITSAICNKDILSIYHSVLFYIDFHLFGKDFRLLVFY